MSPDLLTPVPVFAGAAVLVLFLLKKLVRAVGVPCQFCRNDKLTYFDDLEAAQQRAILRYFQHHEGRRPDTDGVFTCLSCRTVHDDFSGEKRSMEFDVYTTRTFCKVCNTLMTGCHPRNDDIHCHVCGTAYRWQEYEETGLRFLMPPSDARVLERCRDLIGSA